MVSFGELSRRKSVEVMRKFESIPTTKTLLKERPELLINFFAQINFKQENENFVEITIQGRYET